MPGGMGILQRSITGCRLPPHARAQLSPAYMLRQGIAPENLRYGEKARDFVGKVMSELTPASADDVLVSFAFRHLSVLNAMAWQNFCQPDVFSRFDRMLDLKTALDTCFYFGQTRLKLRRNLNEAAQALGFKGNVLNQLERLEAMAFIYRTLQQQDPRIMAFLQAPRAKRLSVLKPGALLVSIDEDKSTLIVLRVLEIEPSEHLVRVVKTDLTGSVSLGLINLDYAPLLAPPSILTSTRQQELNCDLTALKQRLDATRLADLLPVPSAAGAETEVPATVSDLGQLTVGDLVSGTPLPEALRIKPDDMPFYEFDRRDLSSEEQQVWAQLNRPEQLNWGDVIKRADVTTRLGQQVLCFLSENFPEVLEDTLQRQYMRLSERMLERRAHAIVQEGRALWSALNESEQQKAELLQRIMSFF